MGARECLRPAAWRSAAECAAPPWPEGAMPPPPCSAAGRRWLPRDLGASRWQSERCERAYLWSHPKDHSESAAARWRGPRGAARIPDRRRPRRRCSSHRAPPRRARHPRASAAAGRPRRREGARRSRSPAPAEVSGCRRLRARAKLRRPALSGSRSCRPAETRAQIQSPASRPSSRGCVETRARARSPAASGPSPLGRVETVAHLPSPGLAGANPRWVEARHQRSSPGDPAASSHRCAEGPRAPPVEHSGPWITFVTFVRATRPGSKAHPAREDEDAGSRGAFAPPPSPARGRRTSRK